MHLVRGVPIVGEGALEEGGLGTKSHRLGDGHPRPHSEAAGGIRRGLHYSPLVPAAAHDQALHLPELRVMAAANLYEEGVEIDVKQSGRHELKNSVVALRQVLAPMKRFVD